MRTSERCQVQKWIRDLAVSERIRPSQVDRLQRAALAGLNEITPRNCRSRASIGGTQLTIRFMVEFQGRLDSTRRERGRARNLAPLSFCDIEI